MEGAEEPQVEKIYLKTTELDQTQRDAVMGMNTFHYPAVVCRSTATKEDKDPLQMAAIFALRGKDHAGSILADGMASGNKVKALVIGGNLHAGLHMETSAVLAKYRDDIADNRADKATKNNPAPKGSSASEPTAQPPAQVEPPAEECVKAFFHLDTQTPNIELVTQDPKTKNTMSCRLWAQDLARADGRVEFKVAKYQPDEKVDRRKPAEKPEHARSRILETMSQSFAQTCVIEVTIELAVARERYWTGISPSNLAEVRQRNKASAAKNQDCLWDAAEDPSTQTAKIDTGADTSEEAKKTLAEEARRLATRDNLVKILDEETRIKLFFTCKSAAGKVKQWEDKFANYMQTLMSLCAEYGNFWFYRCQIGNDQDIRSPALAKIDWVVPRWLVTQWELTKTTSSTGVVTISNPQPEKWAPLEFPVDGYPDPHEAAFLLKLGVRDEARRQTHYLKQLVQSNGDTWFKGRFRSLDKKAHTYVVEVYLGMESQMADAAVQLPQPGTRIHLEVDGDSTRKPSKENTVVLEGVIVYDALDTSASFICVVNVKGKSLPVSDASTEYSMFIRYIVDDTSHARMMEGIALLQLATDKELAEGAHFGPDSASVILDCREAAPNTAIRARELTEDRILEFEKFIAEFKPECNKVQRTAASMTCRSESGNMVIVGPPGTGKTATIEKIGHGHASLGGRVMFCAPMNSNVHTLVEEFLAQNAQLPVERRYKDNEWVYLTGGYTSIAKATRLHDDQIQGDTLLEKANEKLFAYINDAKNRAHVPHYDRTLGYKVGKQIEVWAKDSTYDTSNGAGLHSDAKSYLETKEALSFYQDPKQKTHAKAHIRALEYNLTVEFLQRVKFLFCTLSTSGHPLVQESGIWDVLIIDEAARESRAGIAVALGTLSGRVKVIVWAGDHKQGVGIIGGKDSNVGYNLLARNVFQSLAENSKKDVASPHEAVTLNVCYRMEQSLINWSSKCLYDGQIKSDPRAGVTDMPLRNMLAAYWKKRLPADFHGRYMQIGIDVTDTGIKSEFLTGTTTRLNREEARQIACTVIEMLTAEIPDVAGGPPCRAILAADFCIIANFTGQVLEIKKALRTRAVEMKLDQTRLDDLWYRTTADVTGKQRPITMYSTVLASGSNRLAKNDHLAIGFVSDVHNLNVSVTRCRVARYTFGALRLFVQARRDGHLISKTRHNRGFFEYIEDMNSRGCIVAYEDNQRWFRDSTKPATSDNFRKKIFKAAAFTQTRAGPQPSNSSGVGGGRNKLKTPAKNTFQQAPADVESAGDREGDVLEAAKPEGVSKKRRRGGKGGTKNKRKMN
jgi:hypothetical protein